MHNTKNPTHCSVLTVSKTTGIVGVDNRWIDARKSAGEGISEKCVGNFYIINVQDFTIIRIVNSVPIIGNTVTKDKAGFISSKRKSGEVSHAIGRWIAIVRSVIDDSNGVDNSCNVGGIAVFRRAGRSGERQDMRRIFWVGNANHQKTIGVKRSRDGVSRVDGRGAAKSTITVALHIDKTSRKGSARGSFEFYLGRAWIITCRIGFKLVDFLLGRYNMFVKLHSKEDPS